MATKAMTLTQRARSGDGAAFDELVAPYRRELQVHCYRMLGSFQDAEDALQDTLLSAWQGLSGFEERSSVRTWLYRIATNRCLNARRSASRRSAKEWNVPGVEPPAPTRLGEVFWLEPFPDALLEGVLDASPPGPEARYEQSEAISLAFVTALQVLPPRQVAVLLLRDVLGYHGAEVAEMLDTTAESVSSALKRARAGLERQRSASAPTSGSSEESALAAKFATAYEAADIETLIALLTDDVFTSMPPMPFEYQGRDATITFLTSILATGRRHRLIPTRANNQPAFGAYLRGTGATSHGVGLFVLETTTTGISAMTRFENGVLPWFGLPRSIPAA
ncbi:RNA polymerase, sigma-24 subunit, ECF subfamily [Catenulispora acidiphila DSM 44928]|uniref:RNA polymerase, sigma-24 subunit, ECF subfamily n=1 Tax=Catenulispora acidiphila (strain DSM 44928 / JCM 14897 / NBRC 102108 / NRRL B-24433 / ID139908) TaxID=479433 RepID=C7Q662_CATAD|nr:RNA polymerase, sigma-24 subunit, ECF subfamily [Catenulispora acidiphila DSM 44928]